MYELQFTGLSAEQAISHVRSLVNSDYLGQYNITGSGYIESRLIKANFGGARDEEPWFTTLKEVAPSIDAILANHLSEGVELKAYLQMYTPEEKKKGFGFDEDAAERLMMELKIYLRKDDKNGTYFLSVSNNGLNKGKYDDQNQYRRDKRRYDRWEDELRKEIPRILDTNKKKKKA